MSIARFFNFQTLGVGWKCLWHMSYESCNIVYTGWAILEDSSLHAIRVANKKLSNRFPVKTVYISPRSYSKINGAMNPFSWPTRPNRKLLQLSLQHERSLYYIANVADFFGQEIRGSLMKLFSIVNIDSKSYYNEYLVFLNNKYQI